MNNILHVENEKYEMNSLSQANIEEIQSLCDSCNDYFLISQGCKTIGNEALDILTSLPPHNDMNDKDVIGIYNTQKKLIGLVDLVKNYPNEGVWIIGLMLIDPKERRKKIGQEMDKIIKTHVLSQSGKAIQLGVLRENKTGRAFWGKLGYLKVGETKSEIKGSQHEIDLMRFDIKTSEI